MLYALVVGIVLSVFTFIIAELASQAYIENKYLSDESRRVREQNYLSELQSFVDRHELESVDTDILSDWVRDNRYLYVMIYKDDQLLLDSDTASKPNDEDKPEGDEGTDELPDDEKNEEQGPENGITVTFPTREDLIAYAKERGTYPIEMTDGIPLLVSLVDYTEYFYYDIVNIISLALAVIVLIIIIMLYFNSITGRITKLAKNVAVVASGDMEHSVKPEAKNKDEIYRLADNVENMRCAMLETIAKEREAINSNTELITSMSHDIRTPLTVLLGYIDLMKMNTADEKLSEYLEASENTAMRLKQMSDDMFGYFVVFGEEGRNVDIEKYEADTLFDQIMSEKVLLLSEQGYEINVMRSEDVPHTLTVMTDAPKLMRIAENIFSNITKYADKSYPVSISTVYDKGNITVSIVNKTLQNTDMVESNGIGLKTCYKLAELIGVDFSAEEADGLFTVKLTLQAAIEVGCE